MKSALYLAMTILAGVVLAGCGSVGSVESALPPADVTAKSTDETTLADVAPNDDQTYGSIHATEPPRDEATEFGTPVTIVVQSESTAEAQVTVQFFINDIEVRRTVLNVNLGESAVTIGPDLTTRVAIGGSYVAGGRSIPSVIWLAGQDFTSDQSKTYLLQDLATDECPDDPAKVSPGVCGCGQPDLDADGDGIMDCVDNCKSVANADQADADHDGIGDACESPRRFVKYLASPGGDGRSWTTAYADLQDALHEAANAPGSITEIYVARGGYYPDTGKGMTRGDRTATFVIPNGVSIYGGLAGNETITPAVLAARNFATNLTVLNGNIGDLESFDDSQRVVTCTNATANLDGLMIMGGRSDTTGAGLFVSNADFTLKNCIFLDNEAFTAGAGIYAESSRMRLDHCVFSENRTTSTTIGESGAAALFLEDARTGTSIQACQFGYNQAGSDGGAVLCTSGNVLIANCTFMTNRAARWGGAIVNWDGAHTRIINCTFTGNIAGIEGGAVYTSTMPYASSATITNCIFFSNNAELGPDVSLANNDVTYSCVQSYITGTGNILASPHFRRAPEAGNDGEWGTSDDVPGDLAMMADSPTINAGDTLAASLAGLTVDLAGAPRFNGPVDMGVFEYYPLEDDADLDDVPDTIDNCPTISNTDQTDNDHDGVGDACDNCIESYNPLQEDQDHNDVGDACETAHLYVNATAASGGDGRSWENAYNSLQDALATARAYGDSEIWVASGTYRPGNSDASPSVSFELAANQRIYGGFAGYETDLSQRHWEFNPTVLSGDLQGNDEGEPGTDNARHVIVAIDGMMALIDGFTIEGGNAFTANESGGGAHVVNSLIYFQHCIFTGNKALSGGAISCWGSIVTLSNCLLAHNTASISGGALGTHESYVVLNSCTSTANIASQGPEVYTDPAGTEGTFVISSIVWDAWGSAFAGPADVTCSCISLGETPPSDVSYDGGTMLTDPLLTTDFHLTPDSPAVNAGCGDQSGQDLDGNDRVIREAPDMGTYESPFGGY